MKIVGVVAEYNPFHNGHERHLRLSRKQTDAQKAVVVMSGTYVQRGEPALFDKYSRADAALRHGADLVAALPAPFSTGAARTFAEAAISYLDRFGFITDLSFGAECEDLSLLLSVARLLADEPAAYKEALRDFLREGKTYAAGMAAAVGEVLGPTAARCLDGPNNLLGIEYLRALRLRDSAMTPLLVQRNVPYTETDLDTDGFFASAGTLRKAFSSGQKEKALLFVPPDLREEYDCQTPLFPDDFSGQLLYRLFGPGQEEQYSEYEDISADLENRLQKEKKQFRSFSSFIACLKTRQVTHARIARALLHLLLDIRKEDIQKAKNADYGQGIHILAAKKEALFLLGQMKDIQPIVRLKSDTASLDAISARILELERHATDLAEIIRAGKSGKPQTLEYQRKFLVE